MTFNHEYLPNDNSFCTEVLISCFDVFDIISTCTYYGIFLAITSPFDINHKHENTFPQIMLNVSNFYCTVQDVQSKEHCVLSGFLYSVTINWPGILTIAWVFIALEMIVSVKHEMTEWGHPLSSHCHFSILKFHCTV